MYLLTLVIVILIILIYIYYANKTNSYVTLKDNNDISYHVLAKYENYKTAHKILSRINEKVFDWMLQLRKLYLNSENKESREMKCIFAMISNYNPEEIYETDPLNNNNDTSFTIDKGKRMYMCIRQKDNPLTFVDDNTIIFVLLHELSHIANYDGWGHEDDFWNTFKMVLSYVPYELYQPIDYRKTPVKYCGMIIDYSPLFD